jgi:predicted  nucleic acid-binding Zn-ribbon protein
MPPVRDLTFQLERFEWVAGGRLELAGRWEGLRGRRLAQPALSFEADGERHRLRAQPGGQLRAGEAWTATFAWTGDAVTIERAELEIGRSLVVDLPAPRRRRARQREEAPRAALATGSGDAVDARLTAAEERLEAERAESDRRIERAREEAAAARNQLARLREEYESTREDLLAQLAETHRQIAQLREDLATAADETEAALTAERSTVASLREELAGEQAGVASLREELVRTQGLLEHRDGQLGATRAGLDREREELRAARARIEELAEELEYERREAGHLRQRLAEPATEAFDADAEWPLEPPPLTEAARRRGGAGEGTFVARPTAGEAADADDSEGPAAEDAVTPEAASEGASGEDGATEEVASEGAAGEDGATEEVAPETTSHAAESNGSGSAEPPPIHVWAARISEHEGEAETTRTLDVPGLEAVREKGARALSALLGRESGDGAQPDAEPARAARPRPVTRRSAAAARGTATRRHARTRTVRQHSREALWAMRIAAVAILLALIVLLAVVLKVVS